jgi:hypothetical protein
LLARPPAADPRVSSEFDIEIIPANVYPLPMQTRASIRRIIDKHGAEHARLVLCILAGGRAIMP